jgi:hypothetical protein
MNSSETVTAEDYLAWLQMKLWQVEAPMHKQMLSEALQQVSSVIDHLDACYHLEPIEELTDE